MTGSSPSLLPVMLASYIFAMAVGASGASHSAGMAVLILVTVGAEQIVRALYTGDFPLPVRRRLQGRNLPDPTDPRWQRCPGGCHVVLDDVSVWEVEGKFPQLAVGEERLQGVRARRYARKVLALRDRLPPPAPTDVSVN